MFWACGYEVVFVGAPLFCLSSGETALRVWHPIKGGFAPPNPYRAFGFPWGKLAAAV